MITDHGRRQFLAGTGCTVVVSLAGCGGGSGGGVTVVPGPMPTPTSVPAPAPTPGPQTPAPLIIAFAGSSSTAEYLSLYTGPSDNPSVTYLTDTGTFETLRQGAFGKTAGTAIYQATGRPVRFVGGGVGATTLAQWAADISPYRAALVAKMRSVVTIDAILVQVGRNDAASGIIASPTAQASLVKKLISLLRSESGLVDTPVLIGSSQDIVGGTARQNMMLGWQRMSELIAVRDDPQTHYGFATYDLAVRDGIHQTEASQMTSGNRFAAQVIGLVQRVATFRGPILGTVTRINATQTRIQAIEDSFTLAPNSSLDGFALYSGGSTIPLSSAIVETSRTVLIGHDAVPGNEVLTVTYAIFTATGDQRCLRGADASGTPTLSYHSGLASF